MPIDERQPGGIQHALGKFEQHLVGRTGLRHDGHVANLNATWKALVAEEIIDALRALAGADAVPDSACRAIAQFTADAAAAHPAISLTELHWAAQLWGALAPTPPATWAETLSALRGPDLWLAAASACGAPGAIAAFERGLMPEVDRTLRRFSRDPERLGEWRQRVRIRLLVAEPPHPPRIGQYRGRGSLGAWVRTVAARLTLNWLRDAERQQAAPLPSVLIEDNPDFARLRLEHREVFVESLRLGFEQLTPRDRNLLRLRYLDEMTAVSLAKAYQVHESTMSRWLAAARETMVVNFAAAVRTALGDSGAVPELIDAMQSRIDASLQGLFVSRASSDRVHR